MNTVVKTLAKTSLPFLRAWFSFHNVGQGLFYSGNIGDFRFVYDCGSTWIDHLEDVVKQYASSLASPKIQLLVLSHLHDDHIAGLDALLNQNRISIDTVILPYLSPIERLMVALAKVDLDPWFYEFWANPVDYLIERGVGTILFLGGSEPSKYEGNVNSPDNHGPFPPKDLFPPREPSINERGKLDLRQMPDDADLHEEIMKKDTQWSEYSKRNKLLTKAHAGNAFLQTLRGHWLFRFFNCNVKDSKLILFEQCVRNIIGKTSPIKIINSPNLKNLRHCYNLLHKDFNNTSIVMYHSPIFPRTRKTNPSNYGGHLLTGDIDANTKLTEISTHFGPLFARVTQCSVPHHGSRKSWNRNLLKSLPQDCRWVISSGIANRYRHPSSKVIRNILGNKRQLSLVNEVNKLCTMMYF